MTPPATLALRFQPALDDHLPRKELRDGLSAVHQVGATVWVANDESATLERLTLLPDGSAGEHRQFRLEAFLDLPCGPEGDPPQVPEVDIEGLDHDGHYLWIAGSHSRKRGKPRPGDGAKAARRCLADVDADDNRYLLARIPLVDDPREGPVLVREHADAGGKRTAARLRDARKGGGAGNQLTDLLRRDKHLAPFLALPGKDNGFDVEGLAVAGDRVFLGLRGPVLRGWATVIALRVTEARKRGRLKLAPLDGDTGGRRLCKHFLDLGGRGVRDLHRDGDDLLVLAGPTMELDGAIAVFRWKDALQAPRGSFVAAPELEHLFDVPHGRGCDRAEGISLFAPPGERTAGRRLLVVYDAASQARQPGESTLLADVVTLPGG